MTSLWREIVRLLQAPEDGPGADPLAVAVKLAVLAAGSVGLGLLLAALAALVRL